MSLSADLISQFVKATNDKKKTKNDTITYGTLKKTDGKYQVQLDGSDITMPVSTQQISSGTIVTDTGTRVIILIKNHTATIIGSLESSEAEMTTLDGIKVNLKDIDSLVADNVIIKDTLSSHKASIDILETDNVKVNNTLESIITKTNYLYVNFITAEDIKATYATIENIKCTNGDVYNLKTIYASAERMDVAEGKIDELNATDVKITGRLDAAEANINDLEANVADIDTLIFGSASGDTMHVDFANAVIALLGNAWIKSAMVDSVSASKITAGDIITNNVRVMSEDGSLIISDETLQISDGTRVRVQIGKDETSDYSINVWDQNGVLMFSKGGITDAAIKDAIIRDDMVSDTANISAHKLNIDSLFEEINGSTKTIKSTQIHLDDKDQTLDVAFEELETDITGLENTVNSQGTQITAIQGQITSKVWQQDIDTAKNEMSTQYSTLEQEVDGFKSTVSKTYTTKTEFNNLEIGGRNLVRDSRMDADTDLWGLDHNHHTISFTNGYIEIVREYDANYTSRTFNNQDSGINPLLMPDKISGETYVLQAELKAVEGIASSAQSSLFWRVYYDDSTSYEEITLYFPNDLSSTEWRRCYVVKTFGTQNWTSSQLTIALANLDNGICVRNIMLEKATKPSAWSPAPEDFEAEISNAEAKIVQNADSITQIVSRTSANESAIASLELTADGLTAKVDASKKQKYHETSGTSGVAGYVGVCTFKITGAYTNRPIMFALTNRGQQSSNVSVCFINANSTDPSLHYIHSDGGMNVWMRKTGTSTWELIVQKSESYDTIYVNDFTNMNAGITVTWTSVHYTELPTDNIVAATRLAAKLTKETVDNAAKTATNYLNFSTSGLVVGDMTASTLGKNVLIDSDSVDVRNGTSTLASFGADTIYLGKNSSTAVINLCNSSAIMKVVDDVDFKIYTDKRLVMAAYDTMLLDCWRDGTHMTRIGMQSADPDDETQWGGVSLRVHQDSVVNVFEISNNTLESRITDGTNTSRINFNETTFKVNAADKIYLTATNGIQVSGNIVMPNAKPIYMKGANGTEYDVIRMGGDTSAPLLIVGDGLYNAGIGQTNINAGSSVQLLVPSERIVLQNVGSSTYSAYFRPNTNGTCTLGTSGNKWYAVYASNGTIQTSDAREKENIIPLKVTDDVHSALFDRLQPVQYNFINGNKKTCYGLIAQQVISVMEELGIEENELDLVHHDFWADEETGVETDTYGLSYNNLIALLIHEVQKLKGVIQNGN